MENNMETTIMGNVRCVDSTILSHPGRKPPQVIGNQHGKLPYDNRVCNGFL